ncbi:MAG: hypothetical protein HY322_07160 [Betaproteobacteria bacterium]|nr:hypothetical protein [Betaproteobacteria bacterium]
MTRGTRWLLVGVAAVLSLVAASCGESTSVTVYKKGEYQGKKDADAWAGEPFKGDKAAWEKAIKARNDGQNEYSRVVAN